MVAPLRAPYQRGFSVHFVARGSNLSPFSPVFFPIITRKHYTEVFSAFLKAVHGCIMRSRGVHKADIEGGRGAKMLKLIILHW